MHLKSAEILIQKGWVGLRKYALGQGCMLKSKHLGDFNVKSKYHI